MIKKLLVLTFICNISYGQQPKIQEYKPIPGVNIEQAFPAAAGLLVGSGKVVLEQMDWNTKSMISSFLSYSKSLILPARSRYQITIDDNSTLHIQMIDIQTYSSTNQVWVDQWETKKDKTLKAELANAIRETLQKPEEVKKYQDWFYRDLYINSRFFEHATELAGNRWFDNYLKDKPVKWKATFNDIKNNADNNYKYMELFSLKVSTLTTDQTNFIITKYTNTDKNTMTSKNTLTDFEGYCRSLVYKDNTFYIVLTDKLETPLPTNSVQEKAADSKKSVLEYAEKLKELKSLLDQGIITKEEYESEKKKVLANKN